MKSPWAAPWYLYPDRTGSEWATLRAAGLAFAVVNVNNGPGRARDAEYAWALQPGSTTPFVGYVHLDYGRRALKRVLRDVAAWREWYGVTDIFLDEYPSRVVPGGWCPSRLASLRADGVGRVVLNPGTAVAPDVLRAADVTCVFEGAWDAYVDPAWEAPPTHGVPATKLWHLVHSVPAGVPLDVTPLTAHRGAGLSWATRGTLPDPWSQGWEAR